MCAKCVRIIFAHGLTSGKICSKIYDILLSGNLRAHAKIIMRHKCPLGEGVHKINIFEKGFYGY